MFSTNFCTQVGIARSKTKLAVETLRNNNESHRERTDTRCVFKERMTTVDVGVTRSTEEIFLRVKRTGHSTLDSPILLTFVFRTRLNIIHFRSCLCLQTVVINSWRRWQLHVYVCVCVWCLWKWAAKKPKWFKIRILAALLLYTHYIQHVPFITELSRRVELYEIKWQLHFKCCCRLYRITYNTLYTRIGTMCVESGSVSTRVTIFVFNKPITLVRSFVRETKRRSQSISMNISFSHFFTREFCTFYSYNCDLRDT